MSFKYGVTDAAGNPAATVIDLNSGQTAPMRATATLLTPEIPTDPLTSQEWYLTDTNVLPVWNDYTGKGVRIGQFEPGGQFATSPEILDIHHPDLASNIDPVWLQTQQTDRTLPENTSNHATMVAGVMAAAKNGQGGVGVAYDATVGGYYLANNGADLSGLGHMVSYDIANNSWGFTNDFGLSNLQRGQIDTESTLVSNAQYAADNGRGGLGTIIVTAGGNQREKGGNAQGSLTNNNRFSIEVGAINAQGDLSTLQIGSSPFSNPGASLLVSAPGSNVVSTSEMLETDQGSTFGSDYSTMQGTSFATPLVSGIVALMLEANPNLGYRDVQEILALSSRTVNDAATQWDTNGARNWNGGGMHTSNDYGFGEVDARAAVRLAESWSEQNTGANETVVSAASGALDQVITASGTFDSTLNMQSGLTVEHAEIDFDANVGRLGDLVVTLISPDGTRSILLNREGKAPAGVKGASDADVGGTQSGRFGYTFMSTHDWGEQSGGNWKLEVTDAASGQPVTLNNWALRLYGNPTSADDTYYYTNEYAAQAATNSARATLDDAVNGIAGGRNTINAAAVSGNTSINLATGIASIGGAALTIMNPSTIQNVVTGDGNDTLTANGADALLDGGRGNNTLIGGSGKDYFVVHRRTGGSDRIVNFAADRGEVIDLVGFKGKSFADLVLTQDGANVRIDLGDGQAIVLQNQTVPSLTAAQFQFLDTFVAPAAYVSSTASSSHSAAGTGTVVLDGGAQGVSYTSDASGQMIGSLAGKVYSHDSATSDTFAISNQPGAASFHNALRGFKHGVDKIDLSQTGVTSFSDLVIEHRNRATFNEIVQIHGVSVSSKSLGTHGTPTELVYLDALDLAQVSESDFIFAKVAPQPAGVVTTPPTDTPTTNPTTSLNSRQTHAETLSAQDVVSMTAAQIQALGTNIQFLSSDAWNMLTSLGTNVVKTYGGETGATLSSVAVLRGGSALESGQSIVAGGMRLTMQSDGNLVINDSANKAVWSSGTNDPANQGARLAMQNDGNLVIYRLDNTPVWWTNTNGSGSVYLVLGSDGTMTLQTGSRVSWLTTAEVQSLTTTQINSLTVDQLNTVDANGYTVRIDLALKPVTPVVPPDVTNPISSITGNPVSPIIGTPAPPVTFDPIPPVTFDPIPPVTIGPISPVTSLPTTPTTITSVATAPVTPPHSIPVPPGGLMGDPVTPPPFETPHWIQPTPTAHNYMVDAAQSWQSDNLSSLFTIAPGDTLTFSATLADGRPLPTWLAYDAAQNRLIGTPGMNANSTTNVKVTAINQNGVSTSSALELQILENVLNVGASETVVVPEAQVAINENKDSSSVTATSGDHVLLLGGNGSMANLQGSGATTAIVTGLGNMLQLGDGNNTIDLTGSFTNAIIGNGSNHIVSITDNSDIQLGNGDNFVSGEFNRLIVGDGNNKISSSSPNAYLDLGKGHDVAIVSGMGTTVRPLEGTYDLDFSGSGGTLQFGVFGEAVDTDHLWFQHIGQDLDISVIGNAENVVLRNWYADTPHQAGIKTGDGKTLASFDVEKLVQAMAAFSPPAAGTMNLTPEQQTTLQPVLAASWH